MSDKELDLFLKKGIEGRTVKRIKKNEYSLDEPTVSELNKIYSLRHKIMVYEKSIVVKTYSPIAIVISVIFTLNVIASILISGVNDNDWDFEPIFFVVPIWILIPAVFFLAYLLLLPSLKKYKTRILSM